MAETFRSLNACRRTGKGRFIGCAQLFLAWFHSHRDMTTLQRKDGLQSFKISKMKMLSGKPLDWSPMRFYTDVETLTGSVYLEF
ncbi:hypothetical protein Goklo_008098, partial [Gossypium klotzschianum]|nr:hypothetical protein [Gossypium klotzschianum]